MAALPKSADEITPPEPTRRLLQRAVGICSLSNQHLFPLGQKRLASSPSFWVPVAQIPRSKRKSPVFSRPRWIGGRTARPFFSLRAVSMQTLSTPKLLQNKRWGPSSKWRWEESCDYSCPAIPPASWALCLYAWQIPSVLPRRLVFYPRIANTTSVKVF